MMIKLTLPLLLICSYVCAQEGKTLNPTTVLKKYEAEYQKVKNTTLVEFASALRTNPFLLINTVPTFYQQKCQTPEKRTWQSYVRSPLLNLQKTLAYLQLRRSINGKLYKTRANEILQKIHQPLDPQFVTDQADAAEIRERYWHMFATIPEDSQLAEQASKTFNQEWPYESVQLDLEAHKNQLEVVIFYLKNQIENLTLTEQNDTQLKKFESILETNIDSLKKAINVIVHRKQTANLKSFFASIVDLIKQNTLEQELEIYLIATPLEHINGLCKSQSDQGNGLLHQLCLSTELSSEQKEKAVKFLVDSGLGINEHNGAGKTILDLIPKSDNLYSFLVHHKAKHSIPLTQGPAKGILKGSYDTPPASPDVRRGTTFPEDKDLPKYKTQNNK